MKKGTKKEDDDADGDEKESKALIAKDEEKEEESEIAAKVLAEFIFGSSLHAAVYSALLYLLRILLIVSCLLSSARLLSNVIFCPRVVPHLF